MPKPTCVQDEIGMQRIRSGVILVEMFNDPPRPYKLWDADLWQCPKCQMQILSGYASGPLMEHFEEGFDEWFELVKQSGKLIVYQYER